MKILVVILAILLAICIVACAPDVSVGMGMGNTVTWVEPAEACSAQNVDWCAVGYVWIF